MCLSSIVLPALGGETMSPRWPRPMGATMSMRRCERRLGIVSRPSALLGDLGQFRKCFVFKLCDVHVSSDARAPAVALRRPSGARGPPRAPGATSWEMGKAGRGPESNPRWGGHHPPLPGDVLVGLA